MIGTTTPRVGSTLSDLPNMNVTTAADSLFMTIQIVHPVVDVV